MKATEVKKHFEVIKSYISAFHMRVDDENVTKARSLIAFCNERIIECNKEIAEEEAKKAEETKVETEA
jgi:hypothetical protein